MKDTKFKLVLGFSVACLLVLIFQVVLIWDLNNRIDELEVNDSLPVALGGSPSGPGLANNNGGGLYPDWSDPFTNMQTMRQRMDTMFDSLFQPGLPNIGEFAFSMTSPNIELEETDDNYQVQIQIPTDHEIELNTELEDNTITITGSIQHQSDNADDFFTSSLFSRSQFSRSLDLPKDVDELGMTTEYLDDKILITIPKQKIN